MGLLDSLVSNFWKSRQGDFVPLKETETFGPGPVLLLYNVPLEIDNDEIQDILSDAAPEAVRDTVRIARIHTMSNHRNHAHDDHKNTINDDSWLELSLVDALTQIIRNCTENSQSSSIQITTRSILGDGSDHDNEYESSSTTAALPSVAVMLFSGFSNAEMMATYNLLGKEIYQEVGVAPACAKAVPNAMEKSLRQVLSEIANDHLDAILLETNDTNDDDDNNNDNNNNGNGKFENNNESSFDGSLRDRT